MEGKLRFLGTGSSLGVPIIGCACSVCTSQNVKNKRMRASALLQIGSKNILIDAGPDHRQQALRYKIDHLDGVIITHEHYDHMGGVDDLKVYSYRKDKLPCLLTHPTFEGVKQKFSYLFSSEEGTSSLFFSCHLTSSLFESVRFQGIDIQCVGFFQRETEVMGVKVGNLAYISDIKTYTQELIEHLRGIEILVISAARMASTEMHFSVDEAIDFAGLIGAKTTYLTHLDHGVDHDELQNMLPQSVFVAYDGLAISFQIT